MTDAVINLPFGALKAAVIGLMVEEGASFEAAQRCAEDVDGREFQRMVRKVASVALTLKAHGLLIEPTIQ